jgi:hypothetical protein
MSVPLGPDFPQPDFGDVPLPPEEPSVTPDMQALAYPIAWAPEGFGGPGPVNGLDALGGYEGTRTAKIAAFQTRPGRGPNKGANAGNMVPYRVLGRWATVPERRINPDTGFVETVPVPVSDFAGLATRTQSPPRRRLLSWGKDSGGGLSTGRMERLEERAPRALGSLATRVWREARGRARPAAGGEGFRDAVLGAEGDALLPNWATAAARKAREISGDRRRNWLARKGQAFALRIGAIVTTAAGLPAIARGAVRRRERFASPLDRLEQFGQSLEDADTDVEMGEGREDRRLDEEEIRRRYAERFGRPFDPRRPDFDVPIPWDEYRESAGPEDWALDPDEPRPRRGGPDYDEDL